MKRTYATLDAIRGVGALLIVVRHTGAYFGAFQPSESFLAVDLFFVLSGFVLAHAYGERLDGAMSAETFMRLRVIRFLPLYLLGLIAGALAAGIALIGGDQELSWVDLVGSLALGLFFLPSPMYGASGWKLFPLNDPSWSLFLELLANAAMAVHWRRLSNRTLTWICLVSGALLAHMALDLGHAGEGFRWISVSMGLLRVSYSFFAGVLIYRLRERLSLGVHPVIALALVAIALLRTPDIQWRAVYDLAWILVGFPVVIASAASREPVAGASIYRFLGLTSYGVYVLHYPAQRLAAMAVTAIGGDVGALAPWSGLIFVASILLLCWGLDRVYDQPLRRWLTRATSRRLASETAPALRSHPPPASQLSH